MNFSLCFNDENLMVDKKYFCVFMGIHTFTICFLNNEKTENKRTGKKKDVMKKCIIMII